MTPHTTLHEKGMSREYIVISCKTIYEIQNYISPTLW
jgi:hypothetical protein